MRSSLIVSPKLLEISYFSTHLPFSTSFANILPFNSSTLSVSVQLKHFQKCVGLLLSDCTNYKFHDIVKPKILARIPNFVNAYTIVR